LLSEQDLRSERVLLKLVAGDAELGSGVTLDQLCTWQRHHRDGLGKLGKLGKMGKLESKKKTT
jgi:hypothetical protein